MARQEALLRLHQSLLDRRAALRDALAGELENMHRLRTDLTGDSVDVAFDSGSEEMSTQLAELEARELNQIERALARLKQSTYGMCEVCLRKIPVTRLNALPYSTTCINCQREKERSAGWDSRRGSGDWKKIYDAEPGMEEQPDINLADIEIDLACDVRAGVEL
jgi:DnaK suppressor protein